MTRPTPQLHIETPLLHSAPLSKLASGCGHDVAVYLKMESLQPSGSFKIRGLGRSIVKANQSVGVGKSLHIVSSSGGNAGLAAAYSARVLDRPCTVFVPTSVEDFVKDLLEAEGAKVVVGGDAWDDCDSAAKALIESEARNGREAFYVHPFEGEDVIDGHATMLHEVHQQLLHAGVPDGSPDIVVCSAGGSGLFRGVLRGLKADKFSKKAHIVVTQTYGANSFGQSFLRAKQAGQQWDDEDLTAVTLPAITSKARSLGAKTCSLHAVRDALQYDTEGQVSSLFVEDEMAEETAWRFARDHRLVVELACSCTLAPIYFDQRILAPIIESHKGKTRSPIVLVIVVCGGNKISLADLEQWRKRSTGTSYPKHSRVELNGQSL